MNTHARAHVRTRKHTHARTLTHTQLRNKDDCSPFRSWTWSVYRRQKKLNLWSSRFARFSAGSWQWSQNREAQTSHASERKNFNLDVLWLSCVSTILCSWMFQLMSHLLITSWEDKRGGYWREGKREGKKGADRGERRRDFPVMFFPLYFLAVFPCWLSEDGSSISPHTADQGLQDSLAVRCVTINFDLLAF